MVICKRSAYYIEGLLGNARLKNVANPLFRILLLSWLNLYLEECARVARRRFIRVEGQVRHYENINFK